MALYHHSPAAASITFLYVLFRMRTGSVTVSTDDFTGYIELFVQPCSIDRTFQSTKKRGSRAHLDCPAGVHIRQRYFQVGEHSWTSLRFSSAWRLAPSSFHSPEATHLLQRTSQKDHSLQLVSALHAASALLHRVYRIFFSATWLAKRSHWRRVSSQGSAHLVV